MCMHSAYSLTRILIPSLPHSFIGLFHLISKHPAVCARFRYQIQPLPRELCISNQNILLETKQTLSKCYSSTLPYLTVAYKDRRIQFFKGWMLFKYNSQLLPWWWTKWTLLVTIPITYHTWVLWAMCWMQLNMTLPTLIYITNNTHWNHEWAECRQSTFIIYCTYSLYQQHLYWSQFHDSSNSVGKTVHGYKNLKHKK